MAWQSGMQGNAWYSDPSNFGNLGTYGCTPPPPPPPDCPPGSNSNSGYSGPMMPNMWPQYPPYGNYYNVPNNWGYGTGPNMQPLNQISENENDKRPINPPLPPDPPPGEPPLPKTPPEDRLEKPKSDLPPSPTPKKSIEKHSQNQDPPEKSDKGSVPPLPSIPPPSGPQGDGQGMSPMPYPPYNMCPPYQYPGFIGGSWYDSSQYMGQNNFNSNSMNNNMMQENNNANTTTSQSSAASSSPIKFSLANKRGLSGQGQQSGFAGQGQQSGFAGQGQQSGFTGQGQQSGFTGKSQQSGFTGQGQQSGFTGQGQQSGFTGKSQQSGFTGQGQVSGFTGQDQQSGFTGQDQQSGFTGQGQQSGFKVNQKQFGRNFNKSYNFRNNFGGHWVKASDDGNTFNNKNQEVVGDKPCPDGDKGTEVAVCMERADKVAAFAIGDWPESLKTYVGKCFARCVTELDKDQVEICLKGKLTAAAHKGILWDKEWDKEPLISVFSVDSATTVVREHPPVPTGQNKFDGDPSRGFYITRRSDSNTRSKSRSLSPFPYNANKNKRKAKKRLSSAQGIEEPLADMEPSKDFISFTPKRGRRGGKRGRGRKGKRGGKNNASNEDNSYFYSKGIMSLEPDLCTQERLNNRAARFAAPKRGGWNAGPPQKKRKMNLNLALTISNAFSIDTGDNIDWSSMHILGTSTILEKQYLRLTSAPDPSTIRTADTLKKSLEHVKKHWVTNEDYTYTCDQLKSIRQDLTVQGVRDDFTVQVYEIHCRLALEKGDHEEFNQCQSQLKDLYCQIGGSNYLEFAAYRLLYYIFTKNTLDMTSMLAALSMDDKKDPCVEYALKLRAAWAMGNYHRFFNLYKNSPKMTGYLVDWFVERERKAAIQTMIKSYRPGNLDANYVKSTLAFNGEEWAHFAENAGLAFMDRSKKVINCKASSLTCA